MIEKVVMYLLGAATTGVGWLIIRWLKTDHVTEEMQRQERSANLIAYLRREGVGMDEVDTLLARIDPKRPPAAPLQPRDREEEAELAAIESADSQQALNRAQEARLLRLERKMNFTIDQLERQLDDDGRALLADTQLAWATYRDSMVRMAGAPWNGGTMQPYIEAAEASALTKRRTEELEAELAARRGMPQ